MVRRRRSDHLQGAQAVWKSVGADRKNVAWPVNTLTCRSTALCLTCAIMLQDGQPNQEPLLLDNAQAYEIGRASCREGGEQDGEISVGGITLKKKNRDKKH